MICPVHRRYTFRNTVKQVEVLGSALRHGVEPETEERDFDVERILRDYKHLIVPGDADLPPGCP